MRVWNLITLMDADVLPETEIHLAVHNSSEDSGLLAARLVL